MRASTFVFLLTSSDNIYHGRIPLRVQRGGLFALRRLARLIPRLRSGLRCYYPLRCKHTHKVHQQQISPVLHKKIPPYKSCMGERIYRFINLIFSYKECCTVIRTRTKSNCCLISVSIKSFCVYFYARTYICNLCI